MLSFLRDFIILSVNFNQKKLAYHFLCGIIHPVSKRSELTGCNTQILSEIETKSMIELRICGIMSFTRGGACGSQKSACVWKKYGSAALLWLFRRLLHRRILTRLYAWMASSPFWFDKYLIVKIYCSNPSFAKSPLKYSGRGASNSMYSFFVGCISPRVMAWRHWPSSLKGHFWGP